MDKKNMFSVIRVILPLVIQVICSQWFAPKTLNYLAFQSFDFEYTWWRLFQVFQSFDFEYTWWRLFWVYLMKVILSIPDEGYFEYTWWRLFWAYLMKVILSVPDEGYFEYTWWRLFQKRVVCTKCDIYMFLYNINF